MYGSASSSVPTSRTWSRERASGRVVRVDRHVLVSEVGEEHLGLAAVTGQVDLVLHLVARPPPASSAAASWGVAAPAVQTRIPSIVMSTASGARPRQRGADRLDDPAPVRVAAVQRGLDERRVGDRRARRGRRLSPSPRTTTRPTRRAPSPSRTTSSASWRSTLSSTSPKRCSSSLSGRDLHPGGAGCHQDHGVARRQLAVDADPVERALDRHPQQQIALLGAEAGVGLDEHEQRRERAARSCRRPSPARSAAPVPPDSSTSSADVLVQRVGRPDRPGEVERAVGTQLA